MVDVVSATAAAVAAKMAASAAFGTRKADSSPGQKTAQTSGSAAPTSTASTRKSCWREAGAVTDALATAQSIADAQSASTVPPAEAGSSFYLWAVTARLKPCPSESVLPA